MKLRYESVAACRHLVVVDIGGTNIKIGALADGIVSTVERIFPTQMLRGSDPVQVLARMVNEFALAADRRPTALIATIPGFLDLDFDRVLYTPNVPELEGVSLASALRVQLGCPIVLERDAVLSLYGEVKAGAAQNSDHILGVFFGTGVGAAFLSGDEPFRGSGWALEIGHIPVQIGQDLRILEDVGSGRALSEIARHNGCTIDSVFLSMETNPLLRQYLECFIEHQSIAIATAIALFSPNVVVVGGGVATMQGFPRHFLIECISERLSPPRLVKPEIRWAELGWRGVLYGAQVAADRLFSHVANLTS